MRSEDFDKLYEHLAERSGEDISVYLSTLEDAYTIKNTNGENLLHKASHAGRADIVKILVTEFNFDMNGADGQGYTPLHEAARAGMTEAARALLELGADVLRKTNNGRAVVECARGNGNAQCIALIEAAESAPRWCLTGEDEISRVARKASIGHSLTEIFNFSNKTYVLLTENTVTHVETASLRTFDDIAATPLRQDAEKAFLRLGGKFPEGYDGDLQKPVLTRRGLVR